MQSARDVIMIVVFGKKKKKLAVTSRSLHTVTNEVVVWPNAAEFSRRDWKPKSQSHRFFLPAVRTRLAWIYTRVNDAWRSLKSNGEIIMPRSSSALILAHSDTPCVPSLRHTAASHHKPNRLDPSASTCCAN